MGQSSRSLKRDNSRLRRLLSSFVSSTLGGRSGVPLPKVREDLGSALDHPLHEVDAGLRGGGGGGGGGGRDVCWVLRD